MSSSCNPEQGHRDDLQAECKRPECPVIVETDDLLRVTEADVRNLLPFSKAVELAGEAYVKLANGEAVNPQRVLLTVPGGASMFFMPARVSGQRTVSIKIARVNPDNPARSLPTVMSDILVYDSRSGVLLAEIPGESLTAIRTAASSAVATDVSSAKRCEKPRIAGYGSSGRSSRPRHPTSERHISSCSLFKR